MHTIPRHYSAALLALFCWLRPVSAGAQAQMTWTFDADFPQASRGYVDDYLELIYPLIVEIYGPPSSTHQVLLVEESGLVGGYYDPLSDELHMGTVPDQSAGTDPQWDYFIGHEFIHAFHKDYYFYSWVEEGMTEAANDLLTKLLLERHGRVVGGYWSAESQILWYDSYANMGAQVLGSVPYSRSYADWVSGPNSYAGLFSLMALGQSTNEDGWAKYTALRELNAAIYAAPTVDGWFEGSKIVELVSNVSTARFDGIAFGDWFEAQPIAAVLEQTGEQLAVYPSFEGASPVNPASLTVSAFRWGNDPTYPQMRSQLPISDGTPVEVEIFNGAGESVFETTSQLIIASPGYPNGNQVPLGDTSAWPAGAYLVKAETTLDTGEVLRASNYFLAGTGDLVTAEDGMGVIAVDVDGALNPIDWSSSDCEVTSIGPAAAVIKPQQLAEIPMHCTIEAEATEAEANSIHTLTIPWPATRVVVRLADRVEVAAKKQKEKEQPAGCSSQATSSFSGLAFFGLVVIIALPRRKR